MKKFISNKYVLYVTGVILFFLLWLVISEIIGEKHLIFPDPFMTFKYMFNLLSKKVTYSYIGFTLFRMIIGFISSLLLALIFGSLAGNSIHLEGILKPFLTIIKSIPTATLVFLFLVISGAKNAPIYIVSLVSFPILYESVLGGFKNVPNLLLEASKMDGANKIQSTLKIKFPLSISYIIVGVASSFALSFKLEIMAEVIVGSTKGGIGSAILGAQKAGDGSMVPIFSYSLIAIILILIIDVLSMIIKKIFQKKKGIALS